MSPTDARMQQLRAEVLRDWQAVEKHLRRAHTTDPHQGGPAAAYVALALDHAYHAFESLLVRIERALGLPERTGSTWHAALLQDAAIALPELRPQVTTQDTLPHWFALLKFRHFLRHAYAVELDANELVKNTAHLQAACEGTTASMTALAAALGLRADS